MNDSDSNGTHVVFGTGPVSCWIAKSLTDLHHSLAYIEDVGRAAAILGIRDEAPGDIWFSPHTPAVTQGKVIEKSREILGIEAKFSVISPFMMRLAG